MDCAERAHFHYGLCATSALLLNAESDDPVARVVAVCQTSQTSNTASPTRFPLVS